MSLNDLTSAFYALAIEKAVSIFVGLILLTLPGILRNRARILRAGELDITAHQWIALHVLMDGDPMAYASAFLDPAVTCMKTISKDRNMSLVHRWAAVVLCERYHASRDGDKWMLENPPKSHARTPTALRLRSKPASCHRAGP